MNYLNNRLTKTIFILSGTVLGLAALNCFAPTASFAGSVKQDSSQAWQDSFSTTISQWTEVEGEDNIPVTDITIDDWREPDQADPDSSIEQTSPETVDDIDAGPRNPSQTTPTDTPLNETGIVSPNENAPPASTEIEAAIWVGTWLVRSSTDRPGLTYIFQPDNILFIVNLTDKLARQAEYKVEASSQPGSGLMEIRFEQMSDPIKVSYQINEDSLTNEDTFTLEPDSTAGSEVSPPIIQLDRQSNLTTLPDDIFILNLPEIASENNAEEENPSVASPETDSSDSLDENARESPDEEEIPETPDGAGEKSK